MAFSSATVRKIVIMIVGATEFVNQPKQENSIKSIRGDNAWFIDSNVLPIPVEKQ
jgi:hypothetical protein